MRTDRDAIAHDAARLVAEGKASSIVVALRVLSASPTLGPSVARHLQAMDLARLGEPGTTIAKREMLESGLAVMEAIDLMESRLADAGVPYRGVRLAGEAARGHPDLRGPIHLRVHGDRSVSSWLAEIEMLEPQDIRTFTSTTTFGRLSGFEVTIEGTVVRGHRCPVDQIPIDAENLFKGTRVPLADLTAVRRLVSSMGGETYVD